MVSVNSNREASVWPWLVWKFGGTSVADAQRLIGVANLICEYCDVIASKRLPCQPALCQPALCQPPPCQPPPCQPALCPPTNGATLGVAPHHRLAVVLSAMAGVTDALQSCCDEAIAEFHRRHSAGPPKKPEYLTILNGIRDKHIRTADALLAAGEIDVETSKSFKQTQEFEISELSEILRVFAISGSCPGSLREMVLGHGELWSSRLLFAVVSRRAFRLDDENSSRPSCALPVEPDVINWIDARQILVIEEQNSADPYEKVTLDWEVSAQHMDRWTSAHPFCKIAIVTGYICSTRAGTPATLKRNGSDYSGSIMANLLGAKLYTVWTDVDGVYTADPNKVPSAFRLPFLSYIEAIELAYFGAKVLHPLTMGPCIAASIPILIRSSLQPESPGTLIGGSLENLPKHRLSSAETAELAVVKRFPLSPAAMHSDEKNSLYGSCKAFTLIDKVALVNVAGTSMIGVPGISSRLFGAVNDARCSVVMISQASSEHSICFAVPPSQAARAKLAIEAAFYREIEHQRCMHVSVADSCSIICAVGERMCGALGILSQLSTALAAAGVNVKAVAQGASEINITFVVESTEGVRAIRAVHDAIYQNRAASSFASVTEGYNGKDVAKDESVMGLVVLLVSLDLPPDVEALIDQLVLNFKTFGTDLSSPRIIGFTDGISFVKTLQSTREAFQEDVLFQERSLLALVDLREWTKRLIPSANTRNASPHWQRSLVDQFLSRGYLVVDSDIRVSPVLKAIHRLVVSATEEGCISDVRN